MAPGSRLSGNELLDTFLDVVLGDDDLLDAEFADIIDGLSDGQPPATTSVQPARGSGWTALTGRQPRRRGDSRRRAVPVQVVRGRGVRSPPDGTLTYHPPDQ